MIARRVLDRSKPASESLVRALYWTGTVAGFGAASSPILLGLYGLSIPAGFYVTTLDAEYDEDHERNYYGISRIGHNIRTQDITTAAFDSFARLWQVVSLVAML